MKKKALFVGGTGTISSAITRLVATQPDWELTLLNRGTRNDDLPKNVKVITADIKKDDVSTMIGDEVYDVVAEFIGFVPEDVERDFRIFNGHTRQYMFISSASAYQKPVEHYLITEETPLENPFWAYSRNKKTCEELLHRYASEDGFPVTIVRPSHTYCERSVPVAVHGDKGSWQVVKRMMEGKPVIIHGDGSSLWTLTHNTDFARGFFGLMGNAQAVGETFHITSDESITWNQIYRALADALGVKLQACYVPSKLLAANDKYDMTGNLLGDKASTVVFDNSKLKSVVPGFKAEMKYRDGVKLVVDYILKHEECQVPDPEFDLWCDHIVAMMQETSRKIATITV
jgi:nucleoside-diphosphate-sugar epimerase